MLILATIRITLHRLIQIESDCQLPERRLVEVLPAGIKCTILADRGFADTKLFGFLDELGFDYVIRLKGNIKVRAADGPTRPAGEWLGQGGRARKLRDAVVTEAQCPVGAVVC